MITITSLKKVNIMKTKIILALVLAAGISACSPTQIVSSWRDPNTTIKDPSAHKIVVAALIYNQATRRQIEDYMASLYPGTATPSYQLFGGDSLIKDEKADNSLLKEKGYDGIVIMRETNKTFSQSYVSGAPATVYHTWGGYWNSGWGMSYYYPGTPGHYVTNRTWHVEVNAYSLIKNGLIWSANTSTTNPGGMVPLFHDVCNTVKKQMKKDGFLI
jgi:hypothetical protein